jgi:hypothetical protein
MVIRFLIFSLLNRHKQDYFSGICFATVVTMIENLRVVAMHHSKDTQKEIITC